MVCGSGRWFPSVNHRTNHLTDEAKGVCSPKKNPCCHGESPLNHEECHDRRHPYIFCLEEFITRHLYKRGVNVELSQPRFS